MNSLELRIIEMADLVTQDKYCSEVAHQQL